MKISNPKNAAGLLKKVKAATPLAGPRGARNASTHMAEALMADATEAMVQTFIDKALEGNMPALILAMKRLLPLSRPQSLQFALPPLEALADAPLAISSILKGLANGDLAPSEAQILVGLVQTFVDLHSSVKDDLRMKALEDQIAEFKADNDEIKAMFEKFKP